MNFNIGNFTHKGTGNYVMNEDKVLINTIIIDTEDFVLENQDSCICFVADGVGGNQGGLYAANFILLRLRDINSGHLQKLIDLLYTANKDLIESSENSESLKGCATTLSGMIVTDSFVDFYHVGDSEIWLLRGDMLLKITKDEVLNEDDPGSSLTNYFGGGQNKLKINTEWVKPEIMENDLFLICSDGLFKSIGIKMVKSILLSDKKVAEKSIDLKMNCLEHGSEDNVSAIVIEVISN